jgi:hypothetical protein
MIDNGNGRDLPRMTRTHDRVSGEDLMVVFYPKAGKITINGDTVVLSQAFSGREGESVFNQILGIKKYTVSTDSYTQLCF